MKVEYPFSLVVDGDDVDDVVCHQRQVTIDAGKFFDLTVQFDPKFKKDRFIRTAESRLDISYVDHPSTDWVALRGDVFYPNLKFEFDEVSHLYRCTSGLLSSHSLSLAFPFLSRIESL